MRRTISQIDSSWEKKGVNVECIFSRKKKCFLTQTINTIFLITRSCQSKQCKHR